MVIIVQCDSCKKTIKAAEKFAGKRVKCPGCQNVLPIPALAASAGAPAAVSPTPTKPAVPSVRPAVAPTPKKPATPSPRPAAAANPFDKIPVQQGIHPALPAADPLANMLDDQIPIRPEQPSTHVAIQTPSTCPGCGTTVPAGAVLCVDCGYDFRAQAKRTQQIGGEESHEGSKKKRKSREILGGHSAQVMQLLRGCLFSFIGACIGAFIWYLVARFTLTEWALISWGLGGLAGMGMAIGYGHEEMLGGICAAVIAFLGIVLAKLAIFAWILGPAFLVAMGDMGGDDLGGEEVADEQFIAEEEFPGEVAGGESSVAEGETAVPVEGVSSKPGGVGAENAEENAEEELGEGLGAGGVAVMGAALFFATMFGIYDVLFIILACATAYKLGSSGVGS